MRSDENVKAIGGGESELADFGAESPRNSFSGGERDNLFVSDRGRQFYDVAGLAGLDDPGDGRTSALLDYDRDGWIDLLVASATEPTLSLYRNRIGESIFSKARTDRFVAVLLEGGNRKAAPSSDWSPREAYGAVLEVRLPSGDTLLREVRCGDGRAAQNSRVQLIGIDDAKKVDLLVRWPSGRRQSLEGIRAGSLVTVFEDPGANRGKEATIERYRKDLYHTRSQVGSDVERLTVDLPVGDELASLHLLIAMSTHCKSCKKAQPQVKRLREAFGRAIGVWGIPVDLEEGPDVLEGYVQRHRPYYDVLAELPMEQRTAVRDFIVGKFLDEVTPATIFLDAEGRVLRAMQGVPTVSEVRRLLKR